MDRRVPLGASSTYRPISTSRGTGRQTRPLASSSQIQGSSAQSPTEHQEGDAAKKKRCRVTREQLEQLEILFAANVSPTIERRKEIAIALGMTDRQTQIWFQNRRAKQRMADGRIPRKRRKKGQTEADEMMTTITPPPLECPPGISAGFDAELHALINEENAVTIIPCDSLSIGTWRRISPPNAKHTLVAYVCEAAQKVSWFIQDAGKGFKISIPFDTIANAEVEVRSLPAPASPSTSRSGGQGRLATPGLAIATLYLSRPPMFSFQTDAVIPGTGTTAPTIERRWHICHDWTENKQATHVLRHCLQGPPIPLRHFINSLNGRLMRTNEEMRRGFRDQGPSWVEGAQDTPSPMTDSSTPSTEYYTPPSHSNSEYWTASQSASPLEMRSGLPYAGDAYEPLTFSNEGSPAIPTRTAGAGQHLMYLDPLNIPSDSPAHASEGSTPQPQVLPGFYGGPQPHFQAPGQHSFILPSTSQTGHQSPEPSFYSGSQYQGPSSSGDHVPSDFGGGMPMPDPSESQDPSIHVPQLRYSQDPVEHQAQPSYQSQVHHQDGGYGQYEGAMSSSDLHAEQDQHSSAGLAPPETYSYEVDSASQQTTPTPTNPGFNPSSSSLAAMLSIPRIPVPTSTKYYTLEYPYEMRGSTSTMANSSTVPRASAQVYHQHQHQQQAYLPPTNDTGFDSTLPSSSGNTSNLSYSHQPTVLSTPSQPSVADAYFQPQDIYYPQPNYTNPASNAGLNPVPHSIISPAPRYIADAQRLQEDVDSFGPHQQQQQQGSYF